MSMPALAHVAVLASIALAAPFTTLRAQTPPPPPVPGAPAQQLPVRLEWERFMSSLRSGAASLPPGVTVVDSTSSPRVRAMAAMLQHQVALLNAAHAASAAGAATRPLVECPMPVSRVDSARVPDMPVGRGDSTGVAMPRITPPCVNPLDR